MKNTQMMNDIFNIKRFVPLLYMDGKPVACGFIVNNLLLTDAHAISPYLFYYVEVDGQRIFLDKSNEVYFNDDENNPNGFDLAIYSLGDVQSPFS